MMRNKRADIAVMIFVIGVIALCILSLLSFYLAGEKQKSGGINSFSYLQRVYNLAESVRFSESADNYEDAGIEGEGFVIEKTFSKTKGLIRRKKVEILKVKYGFEG